MSPEELSAWTQETRLALVHLATHHPIDFAGVLAGLLIANTILAGTGRGIPEYIRPQLDRVIAEIRTETCVGCKAERAGE